MPRSPLVLAALANAAVPGLRPVAVRADTLSGAEFDVAMVMDDDGGRWTVRAPRRAAAGAQLEAELQLLAALRDSGRVSLPFAVPAPAGTAPLPEGGRCVVYPYLPGSPLHPADLGPGPGLAGALGRAIAALHDAPRSLAEDVGLPVYDADEYRDRRMGELDRAAGTGSVPPRLLGRWERALEDVGRWKFQPCLVHGDLLAEHVLVADGQVAAILGWSEAKVADPADDLAWVAVGSDRDALESVLQSYRVSRAGMSDPHLAFRARLAGELAVARWLLHGVRSDDAPIVDDARQMLRDLDADVGEERL